VEAKETKRKNFNNEAYKKALLRGESEKSARARAEEGASPDTSFSLLPGPMYDECELCPPSKMPYYDSKELRECKYCHKKYCPNHRKPKQHSCIEYEKKSFWKRLRRK